MARPRRTPPTSAAAPQGPAPPSHEAPSSPRRSPGRPRLTADEWRARVADYCRRHGVTVREDGLPPFPSGRRESPQHREWMALYKAHRRLAERLAAGGDATRRHELLAAQGARCPVCREPLAPGASRLDDGPPDPAVLHERCLELVVLARTLGPEALDRAKARA